MRVTNKGAKDCITLRRNFDANSMSGRWTTDTSTGQMPDPGQSLFKHMMSEAIRQNEDMFVVYSYATPIAWYSTLTMGWTYTGYKYSPTTSRHQSITRMAIDMWDGNEWAHDYTEVS